MSRLVVKVLLVAGCCVAAAQAATVAEAIRQLGDDSYLVREKATKDLWRMGKSAEAALKEAAESGDPEVAARAAAVLQDIRDHIPPDAPPRQAARMREYLRGADEGRDRILLKLLEQGRSGWEAAMSLVRRAGPRPGPRHARSGTGPGLSGIPCHPRGGALRPRRAKEGHRADRAGHPHLPVGSGVPSSVGAVPGERDMKRWKLARPRVYHGRP